MANPQPVDDRWAEEPYALVPEADPEDIPHASNMRIEVLNPTKELMKWFYVDRKFVSLSKCQAKTLPHIVTPPHKNIIFHSSIGSGKSTGIVMAILFRVDPKLKFPQAICIVPNSYLAIQIMDLLLKMGKHSPITCVLGLPPCNRANYIPPPKIPPVEAQVIIGTPGTIHRWIAAKKLDIGGIKMFLIDDVDFVLAEPGFKDDVVRIMKAISTRSLQCQVIMCSTKSSVAVEAFITKTKEVPNENEYIAITESLDNVNLYKVNVPNEPSKVMVLNELLCAETRQAIIYVNTIDIALKLCERLEGNRFMSKTLDDAYTKEQIYQILEEFKEQRFQVLISTTTLDRGFDLSQVGLVVFFDLSILLGSSSEPDLEQYSQCIGRAGQFDHKGAVFHLMCGDMDKKIMEKIETLKNVNEVLWNSDSLRTL